MLEDGSIDDKIRNEVEELQKRISKTESSEKTRTDICDIMQDIVDEVSKEIKHEKNANEGNKKP